MLEIYLFRSLLFSCCCCWEYTTVNHNTPHKYKGKSYQNSYSSIHFYTKWHYKYIARLRLHFNSFLAHIFDTQTHATKTALTITHSLARSHRFVTVFGAITRNGATSAHTPHTHLQIDTKIAAKKNVFFSVWFNFFLAFSNQIYGMTRHRLLSESGKRVKKTD